MIVSSSELNQISVSEIKEMRSKRENWITLKEASQISGYSQDYLGQLIRKGKLPGKPVVSKIAWMTTKEAILEYKNRENSRKNGNQEEIKKSSCFDFKETKERIFLELRTLGLFFKTFKTITALILILIISFSFLTFYVIFASTKGLAKAKICPGVDEESAKLKF